MIEVSKLRKKIRMHNDMSFFVQICFSLNQMDYLPVNLLDRFTDWYLIALKYNDYFYVFRQEVYSV